MKKYYNSFIREFSNELKAQVKCKDIKATLPYQIFVIYR